jgi:NAD(P)-dependent dehydrogenase (short-subunit alcohol dehydrogenase family)
MKFENSTFIVTGGASGLGEATVRRFHGAGANLVIADLNVERGTALAVELGARATFARTDVTLDADGQACVAAALARFSTLHGLVNCAGVGTPEKVLGKNGPQPLANFAKTVGINLIGTFNMLRLAADAISKGTPNSAGERGVIINTASVAAYDGQIGQPAYAASKAGVVGLTLPAARELARFGIRVCTIAPGLFFTPMMESLPAEVQDSLAKSVPFPPRLGRPDEYAQLAAHIVENEMLNGETIRLDGALRMAPK